MGTQQWRRLHEVVLSSATAAKSVRHADRLGNLAFESLGDPLGRGLYAPECSVGVLATGDLEDFTAALLTEPKVLVEASHRVGKVTALPLPSEECWLTVIAIRWSEVLFKGHFLPVLQLNQIVLLVEPLLHEIRAILPDTARIIKDFVGPSLSLRADGVRYGNRS